MSHGGTSLMIYLIAMGIVLQISKFQHKIKFMKIVFTGGGTGGHFYPIIAVAQKVNQIIDKDKIIRAKLYYVSDSPYDKEMLS